ncbi:DUF2889 domain-containing protein [Paenalcaligenes hermetiae]|uniref:DUF2889 domain-containing protein n=1 Tax=Paenalcaligenes hermetiae TaxID=1157987 RepID=A0ABP9MB47_9BURK
MSLPTTSVKRSPLHKRAVTVEVFEREDGLWDLDAVLVDTKSYDFPLFEGGVHPAGQPVHHMLLRITIDDSYTIVDAAVQYEAAPYKVCATIADDYRQLIGLNLLRGFRHDVRARLAGRYGCTHMTELTNVLPTAAVQGIATRLNRIKATTQQQDKRPFHIDGCHALRADGDIVRVYYPKWYEKPDT